MAKQFLCVLLLILASLAAPVFANKMPLPADKAFNLSVSVENQQQVNAKWEIAPGYYLYRKRFSFTLTPAVPAEIHFPKGEIKQDLNHGENIVYSGNLLVPVVLKKSVPVIQLTVQYQGCSEKGFCYPPAVKTMTLNMGKTLLGFAKNAQPNLRAMAAAPSWHSLLTSQNSINEALGSYSFPVLLFIFTGLGLLLAFTPCVLPMVPILTSIIVGHKQPVSYKKAGLLSFVYVLGSSLTYAAAGLFAAYMGSSLQTSLQQPWIMAVTSSLFVFLAMSLFGIYDLRLPGRWQNRITVISRKQEGGTYAGVFIMGIISTLIVSPCVTAPLVGVLMFIAQSGNLLLGASALFAMGLGMGIPLIVIGISAGRWLPKRGVWMILVQYLFGLMMLGMALWLLSRAFSLSTLVLFSVVLLTGILMLLMFSKRVSIASGMASILLVAAISAGFFVRPHMQNVLPPFTIVKNLNDINHQLFLARTSGKPVILDFYADWCESCVAMDKNVFSQPSIIHSLNQFILLRADLSENSVADELMLKNYGVIAPPTVLFFNTKGQEINSHRIVGELDAQEFLSRINTFNNDCNKKVSC